MSCPVLLDLQPNSAQDVLLVSCLICPPAALRLPCHLQHPALLRHEESGAEEGEADYEVSEWSAVILTHMIAPACWHLQSCNHVIM